MLSPERYYELQLETSTMVAGFIRPYLATLAPTDRDFFNVCSEIPEEKSKGSETRAYFARMVYENLSGKPWNDQIGHLIAAFELELSSMYYLNRVLDEKGGVVLNEPGKQLLAAHTTHALGSIAFGDAFETATFEDYLKAKQKFDEIHLAFSQGEFIDVYKNIFNPNQPKSFDEMLKTNKLRTSLINAVFYEKIAEITSILAKDGTREQTDALVRFGYNFGMAQQIINDIADFVPPADAGKTDEKVPEDAYSDIKHGKLTLPIIYALENGSDREKQAIRKSLQDLSSPDELIEITRVLIQNGSITFAQKEARKYISEAKREMNCFSKEQKDPFESMCFVAYNNRYYKALREYR
jgi:octaprenyl-diphosphate synthase